MPIDITLEKLILLRIRPSHDDEVDFDELSSMADRLFHGNVGRDVVLSFPDNFVPAGKQIGYIILWGNTMRQCGGNLGIITKNTEFRQRLSDLVFAFQIRHYESEEDIYKYS